MSTRNWRLRVEDILEAIERIEEYTKNYQYHQWQQDRKTINAVIHNIEIIGETARHIPEEIQKNASMIPWSQMKGIRNILIREYFGVETEVLWKTV